MDTDGVGGLQNGGAQFWRSRRRLKGAVCHNTQIEPDRQTALSSYCHGEQGLTDTKRGGRKKVSLLNLLWESSETFA